MKYYYPYSKDNHGNAIDSEKIIKFKMNRSSALSSLEFSKFHMLCVGAINIFKC